MECLTDKQLAEFYTAFKMFDSDGSGTISGEELVQVMQTLGLRPNVNEVEELIKKIDTDEGGEVDFSEFLNLMVHKMEALRTEEQIFKAFRVFDRDRNGLITKMELKWVMARLGEPISEEEAEQMIRDADTDGDGLINYQEFYQKMLH